MHCILQNVNCNFNAFFNSLYSVYTLKNAGGGGSRYLHLFIKRALLSKVTYNKRYIIKRQTDTGSVFFFR